MHKPLTSHEKGWISEAYRRGVKAAEIARAMGRGKAVVGQEIRRAFPRKSFFVGHGEAVNFVEQLNPADVEHRTARRRKWHRKALRSLVAKVREAGIRERGLAEGLLQARKERERARRTRRSPPRAAEAAREVPRGSPAAESSPVAAPEDGGNDLAERWWAERAKGDRG